MESYKAGGNLNYSDLESESVSEVKGYGPCRVCSEPTSLAYPADIRITNFAKSGFIL